MSFYHLLGDVATKKGNKTENNGRRKKLDRTETKTNERDEKEKQTKRTSDEKKKTNETKNKERVDDDCTPYA